MLEPEDFPLAVILAVEQGFGVNRMEKRQSHRAAIIWRLIIAGLLPFVVLSCYLFFSRWPTRWFTTASDYAGFIVSIVTGLAFIVTLPIHLIYRIASSFFYVFIFWYILAFYALEFVGVVFGDWL